MYRLAEIALYNFVTAALHTFCHLSIRKDTRQFTDPATRTEKEKKYNTVKDIRYKYNTEVYDDAKLYPNNSR